MTVTGSGFNDGAVAAVYVLHDPSVGSEAFDDGVNETALCERIIRDGFWVGGAFVGSDDRVSVSFEVTVPTFRPGNSNYLCMIDGEGRMSHPDVERFHLEHWIRLNPSNVMPGDTVTIFAQDFPNPGTGFTELKLDGQTATGNVTSTSSIGVDGSGTATLVVPGGLAGTVGVEAAWGNVSATSSLTVIGSAQSPAPTPSSPPPTTNVQVRDGPNPGEVVISWQAVPEATHYRIGYVNMVTDYPLAKASRTGNWLEAFVYVDVEAQNFTVVGGRTEYTIRRLAQGVRHAFTVRTGNSPYGDFTWPSDPRWKFHTIADRGGACPTARTTIGMSPFGQSTSKARFDQSWDHYRGISNILQTSPEWSGIDWNIAATVGGSPISRMNYTVAPTGNVSVRDGHNPGEVVISWDAVPRATHYRIGYVNMVTDYPLAKASRTGNWLEAFVYVDVEAQNFTVVGGRTEYTLRRLEQGVRHAFTVRTGDSPYGDYTWPSNPRWRFHTVADRGGACPSARPMPDPTFATERAALEALYMATGGASWTNNTNWLSHRPVGDWFGVTTNAAGHVTHINLPGNQLQGEMPAQLAELITLESLNLSHNQLGGEIPSQLGDLVALKELRLDDNRVTGPIPPQLGNLSNLRELSLTRNRLSGSIPAQLGDLSQLRSLLLFSNQLDGKVPESLGRLAGLILLRLDDNRLSERIPAELGDLSNLAGLELQHNQFNGPIPAELGQLSELEWLIADDNRLSGSIPSQLGNLSRLQHLYLGGNQLSGPIPSQLGDLSSLQWLDLSHNQLSGPIPSQLGNLFTLESLYLGGNQLSGPIPSQLGNLSNLHSLDLGENQLSGPIPPQLGNLSSLQTLHLGYNQLGGPIPSQLGNLSNLRSLGLWGNQLSGPIPSQLGNLSSLQSLSLHGNQLTGPIPPQLGNLSSLQTLHLGDNQLGGPIPPLLGNLSNLHSLDLGENQLSGPIPSQLGNLSSLQHLYLGGNQLSGPIPSQLGNLSTLESLDLGGNQLSGPIPSQLGDLSSLQHLYLGGNQLSGAIPSQLGDLSSLQWLDLSLNQLSGAIPSQLGNLSNLHSLDLGENQLSGPIPSQLGNLFHLWRLDLRSNQLSGSIPSQLGNLISLERANLSDNQIGGQIPQELANLINLTDLNLHGNQFSGCMPRDLRHVRGTRLSLPVCDGDLVCAVHAAANRTFAEARWADVPAELNGTPLTAYEVVWTTSGADGTSEQSVVRLGQDDTRDTLTLPEAGARQAVQISLRGIYNQRPGKQIHEPCVDYQLERAALISVYLATGGENWSYSYNWLTHQEVGTWAGVRTGHNGGVIGLSLSHQGLIGEVPRELVNLRGLRKLQLADNQLAGPIPVQLGTFGNLTVLDLRYNQLTGMIPRELANLTELRELGLGHNQLSGNIPSDLGNLVKLYSLDLSQNQLIGEIPKEWGNITFWREWRLIAGNALTGCIPYGMQFAPGDPGDSASGDLPFCAP